MGAHKGWREAGCYGWRTRKPHALLGLPFIGRHWGYIGETGSRYHRDEQHVPNSTGAVSRYAGQGQPWGDLDPKVYPLPCAFPNWAAARKAQETLWILLLLPVYNDSKNKANPRRIRKEQARLMRDMRDSMGLRVNVTRFVLRGAVMLTFWGAVIGGAIEWGLR